VLKDGFCSNFAFASFIRQDEEKVVARISESSAVSEKLNSFSAA
jgi:hypothetical protein